MENLYNFAAVLFGLVASFVAAILFKEKRKPIIRHLLIALILGGIFQISLSENIQATRWAFHALPVCPVC